VTYTIRWKPATPLATACWSSYHENHGISTDDGGSAEGGTVREIVTVAMVSRSASTSRWSTRERSSLVTETRRSRIISSSSTVVARVSIAVRLSRSASRMGMRASRSVYWVVTSCEEMLSAVTVPRPRTVSTKDSRSVSRTRTMSSPPVRVGLAAAWSSSAGYQSRPSV